MNEMEGSKKFQTDAIVFEDLEASDRIKASESSGIEEPFDPFMLNLEITPTRRLTAYDDSSKELYFEDGTAVSIDPVSLAKEFKKCSTGLSPHECIYHIGKPDVRSRFPKGGRSSGGLNFSLLDPNANFAARLRDTWLREYKDEPMPENLRMRFVAACIVEERGEPVNWALELANSVRAEIKQHDRKKRDSLSPGVLKLIVHLLEKHAPPAAASLPVFEAVKEEEAVDLTEYDHCCDQCKHGGELLCCDGRGCRKTFHLQCLDPPLEEVPETAFYCPSCLAKASTPPGVEGGTSRAGLATQTAVQPLVNQRAPQQISGRPRTTMVSAHASISRSSTNTVNAGSGITMQPPETSSTHVSTAPVHHSPRYGMPLNEQSRPSMSEAMAVLAARLNGDGSGINATGSSRAQMESVPPEMKMDVNGSSEPRTSPGVLASMSPSFQDPILAIIRNSRPAVEANSPSPSETVSSAGASLPNPHLSEPTAGIEYQTQHSQASPQTNPGADSAPIVERALVQMTSQVRSGAQEQVANAVTLEMPQNVIYLSDSED